MSSRVLVTGATGFIGGQLVARLSESAVTFDATDRQVTRRQLLWDRQRGNDATALRNLIEPLG